MPHGRVTLRRRPVNWKNVADNYSDGLHIPVAHPGLMRIFGKSYAIEARVRELAIYARLRLQQLPTVDLLTPARPG